MITSFIILNPDRDLIAKTNSTQTNSVVSVMFTNS